MAFLNIFLTYIKVFAIGGALCAIAELLLIKTKKLTPATILVGFLLLGMLLEAVGIFEPIKKFAQAGVTVPIIGFGASLAKGAIEAVKATGWPGMFTGGLTKTAMGIGGAVIFSFITALIFSPKSK